MRLDILGVAGLMEAEAVQVARGGRRRVIRGGREGKFAAAQF